MKTYDLIIIGAGPGGYTAAIKAAELNMKVAIIDKGEIGGGCVNRGCIPTKVLLHCSKIFYTMQHCDEFGVYTDSLFFEFAKMQKFKDQSVNKYRSEIEESFKKLDITFYQANARIHAGKVVELVANQEISYIQSDKIILASGAVPSIPNIPGIEFPGVITSDQLLDSTQWNYNELVIIGGGVIGVEFATIFRSLFSNVTIVEVNKHLLGSMDEAVTVALEEELVKKGIRIKCNTVVEEITQDTSLYCTIRDLETNETSKILANRVLIATGRKPKLDSVFARNLEFKKDNNGRLVVDRNFQTSEEGIYAIGDVISDIQLAHVATAQGTYVVEKIAGIDPSIRLEIVPQGIFASLPIVPHCIYTSPEVATVGITEAQAIKLGMKVRCGVCYMKDNGKSIITGQEGGFIRLIFETYTNRLVGAQMVCARATDMIGEMATAIANNLSAEQLLRAMRAHPTYSEGIKVAIEDFLQ